MQDVTVAATFLMKVFNQSLDVPFVLKAISPVAILECVKPFIRFTNTVVRILSLVIINKIRHCLDASQVYHWALVAKQDVVLCLNLLQMQSLLLTSDILSVLESASHSLECMSVFKALQVVSMLEAMELNDQCKAKIGTIKSNIFESDVVKCTKLSRSSLEVVPCSTTAEVECNSSTQSTDRSGGTTEAAAQIIFLENALGQLTKNADSFKSVVFRRDISNRDSFIRLDDSLAVLQILLHSQLSHSEILQRLTNLILNIICDFLQGK